jgi:hypothetical protein
MVGDNDNDPTPLTNPKDGSCQSGFTFGIEI